MSLRQLVRNLRTNNLPLVVLVDRLKKRALKLGGKSFQVPGVIERDLYDELKRPESEWVAFDGALARVAKSSKGIPMQTRGCHENAAVVALQRNWECWTGLALSADGCWRVHSWVRIPSTGRLLETTTPRTMYLGVKLSKEDTEDLL